MYKLGSRSNVWKVDRELADLSRATVPAKPAVIDAAPQRVKLDLARTALIIVDMQNDFCSKGGWVDYIGGDYAALRSPIGPLNRLVPALRAEGVPIVWLNWGNREDRLNLSPSVLHVYNGTGEGVGIGEPLPGNGSKVLERGSWGAAIVDELDIAPDDIHVDKYRMSGFWDTPLDSILRNMRIETVLLAGVNLDQCVMATLQDAVNCGYDSILLQDCSATNSPSYCADGAIYNIKQCYGFVADSASLLQAIEGAALPTETAGAAENPLAEPSLAIREREPVTVIQREGKQP